MDKKSQNSWFYGVILGIGVGAALTVALDNPTVGISVGVGVMILFAAGIYRRGRD